MRFRFAGFSWPAPVYSPRVAIPRPGRSPLARRERAAEAGPPALDLLDIPDRKRAIARAGPRHLRQTDHQGEALEGDGPADVLAHFSMTPALAGQFVVLTPRMVGFVADTGAADRHARARHAERWPAGSRRRRRSPRSRVDLSRPSRWRLPAFPSSNRSDESTPPPSGLNPTIAVTANAAVDPASLAQPRHAGGRRRHRAARRDAREAADAVSGSGAQEHFDPSLKQLGLRPQAAASLRTATTYALANRARRRSGLRQLADAAHLHRRRAHVRARWRSQPTPAPESGQRGGPFRRRRSGREVQQPARPEIHRRAGDDFAGAGAG